MSTEIPPHIAAAVAGVTRRPERCDACKFAHFEGQTIECRRMPPDVLQIVVSVNEKTGMPTGFVDRSTYPKPTANWWCGEWRQRIAIAS